jgi:hypothetical protein
MKKLIVVLILCFSFFACDELMEQEKRTEQEKKQKKIDLQTMGNRLQITYGGERDKLKYFIVKDTKLGREYLIVTNNSGSDTTSPTITPLLERSDKNYYGEQE